MIICLMVFLLRQLLKIVPRAAVCPFPFLRLLARTCCSQTASTSSMASCVSCEDTNSVCTEDGSSRDWDGLWDVYIADGLHLTNLSASSLALHTQLTQIDDTALELWWRRWLLDRGRRRRRYEWVGHPIGAVPDDHPNPGNDDIFEVD